MISGPITGQQWIEAIGIVVVVCITLGAIGAIVVNRMRLGDVGGDDE